jgi:hypothetical protein
MKKNLLIYPVLFLFLLSGALSAQTEMTVKEYNAALEAGVKREQTAKEGIAVAQASVATLKEQLKETTKQTEKNRADMFAAAGTTPEGLTAWQDKLNTLQSQTDAFAALSTADVLARQAEVPGMETQFAALKQDPAALVPDSPVLLSAAENSLNNAKAAIAKAQQDNVASAEAAKQAQLDEKKRKVEEARQASWKPSRRPKRNARPVSKPKSRPLKRPRPQKPKPRQLRRPLPATRWPVSKTWWPGPPTPSSMWRATARPFPKWRSSFGATPNFTQRYTRPIRKKSTRLSSGSNKPIRIANTPAPNNCSFPGPS